MEVKVGVFINDFLLMQLKTSWAGFYDYNWWDQNPVIGNHPGHNNVFMATGLSGQGKSGFADLILIDFTNFNYFQAFCKLLRSAGPSWN